MSLVPLNLLGSSNVSGMDFVGTVVENVDPKGLGRIRVTIPNLLESDDISLLPFISSLQSVFHGGISSAGSFSVPEIGSKVLVKFLNGDIYFGVYYGVLTGRDTIVGDLYTQDGHRHGWIDNLGNRFVVDKVEGTYLLQHALGYSILMNKDGIQFITKDKIKFTSSDGKNYQEIDLSTGKINQVSDGSSDINTPLFNVVADSINEDVGNRVSNVKGRCSTVVLGDMVSSSGGNMSISSAGDLGIVSAGDVDLTYSQSLSETVGSGVKRNVVAGGVSDKVMAGNYSIDLLAGNVSVETKAGNVSVASTAGNVSVETKAGMAGLKTTAGVASVDGTTVQLGKGTEPAVKGQSLMQWLSTHTHLTAVGPSSVSPEAVSLVSILSTKIFLE